MSSDLFNPDWRDDVFEPTVLDMPVVFPADTPADSRRGIWVQSNVSLTESAFGQDMRHAFPRRVKHLLKRSELIPYHVLQDGSGTVCPPDSPVYDVLFPPQSWMTDSLQERCMVYQAARLARGRVLVGGLGLAVYPQLCLHLNRPIQAITIIEKERAVIDLVMGSWQPGLDQEKTADINVIEGTIESYLEASSDQFDTIYLDTWDNIDSRYLSAVNHLIQIAAPKCAPHGQIQCWGYALMVDTFVDIAAKLAEKPEEWMLYNMDPALAKFFAWLEQNDNVSAPQDTIKTMAREIATTTVLPLAEYKLHECLTLFARSRSEFYTNLGRARKRTE